MGAISTYVVVPVEGNATKEAIRQSEKIALEKIGNEPGELEVVKQEVVVVGRIPYVTGQDEEGNDVVRERLELEVRTTFRKCWEDPSNVPKDQHQDLSEVFASLDQRVAHRLAEQSGEKKQKGDENGEP